MGIQGLLPLLKSIADAQHVSAYSGHRVGIDTYAWLHRGGHQCATELALKQPTDRHLQFCIARLRLLLSNNVRPVLVFDGGRLPEKRKTEEDRAAKRRKERELGKGLWAAGQAAAAFKAFQRCVSIHPGMAYQLIQLIKELHLDKAGVEWLVAPYEADAQLAYLSHINYVTAVISEDSDLLVFGCRRVLYKMDAVGNGEQIRLRDLGAGRDLPLMDWSQSQFQQMCVLAGCDYLPSLPSMGMKKAHALIRSTKSWDRAIKKLKLDGKVRVYPDYERDFQCALLCFQHQRVWDPKQRRLVFLTELSDDVKAAFDDLSFLGPHMSDDVAARIANCELHPETLREFTDADMEGIPLQRFGALRRTHSESEVVTADIDMGGAAEQSAAVAVSVPALARRKVAGISALLVKNKIDSYFVGASEASRSGFVRPRSAKEGQQPDTEKVERVRSASTGILELHAEASLAACDIPNPFAAFTYGMQRAVGNEEKADTLPGEVEAAVSQDAALEVDQATARAEDAQLIYSDDFEHAEEEWEDQYEQDEEDDQADILARAYSLPLRSQPPRPHSYPVSPPHLQPLSEAVHDDPLNSAMASTFAGLLPPALVVPPVCDDEPSPSPSPPPPVTSPVYSKYFASSAPSVPSLTASPESPAPSPAPLDSPHTHARPMAPVVPSAREELLVSDDDADDLQVDSGSDKENVDRNLSSASAQRALDDEIEDIEDVPSPPLRPSPSPAAFFTHKRPAHFVSPDAAEERSPVHRGPRIPFPLSAPAASAGRGEDKRRKLSGGREDDSAARTLGSLRFFDQFRYTQTATSLPPPPLASYAFTAQQLRRSAPGTIPFN